MQAQSLDAIVFLHASASSGAKWREYIDVFASQYQVFAPDFLGEGRSILSFEQLQKVDITLELERMVSYIEKISSPVTLVGHSYGGLIALLIALKMPKKIRSVVAIEPIAFDLLLASGPTSLVFELESLWVQCQKENREGSEEEAARLFFDYFSSPGFFNTLKSIKKEAILLIMPKVYRMWQALLSLESRFHYENILCKVTILYGNRGPGTTRWIAHALSELLPNARHGCIDGAGHMAPITHAKEVMALILEHLSWVYSGSGNL